MKTPTLEDNARSLRKLLTLRKSTISCRRQARALGMDTLEYATQIAEQTAAARAYIAALRTKTPCNFIPMRYWVHRGTTRGTWRSGDK